MNRKVLETRKKKNAKGVLVGLPFINDLYQIYDIVLFNLNYWSSLQGNAVYDNIIFSLNKKKR